MTLENLKTARIFVPGVIIFLVALGLFVNPFSPTELGSVFEILTGAVYLIIVVAVGGIYDRTGVRWRLLADSLERIDNNIKNRLLQPFRADAGITKAEQKLLQGRKLLDIFYYFVDKDESLKQRSKEVYFNGLIWSTLADIMFLCGLGSVLYIIAYLYSPRVYIVGVTAILLVAVILALLLLGPVERDHMKLGNNQVDYIVLHYSAQLHQKLLEAAAL